MREKFFAAARPDIWEKLAEMEQEQACGSFEVENAQLGMDHGLIGAAVLHHWKLPLLLTEPINLHHSPELSQRIKWKPGCLPRQIPWRVAPWMPTSSRPARVGTCRASRDSDAVGATVIECLIKIQDAGSAELEE